MTEVDDDETVPPNSPNLLVYSPTDYFVKDPNSGAEDSASDRLDIQARPVVTAKMRYEVNTH